MHLKGGYDSLLSICRLRLDELMQRVLTLEAKVSMTHYMYLLIIPTYTQYSIIYDSHKPYVALIN